MQHWWKITDELTRQFGATQAKLEAELNRLEHDSAPDAIRIKQALRIELERVDKAWTVYVEGIR